MARRIGLTGGIGSGKSTVARLLVELGATVIDADRIVHELQAPGAPVLAEIVEAFGREILCPDGSLDRAALGDLVFRDADARARLNRIVHPRVAQEMARREQAAREAGAPLVVLDVPLLLEGRRAGTGTGARMGFDAIVVVWVPEAVQIERTVARDRCSREEALRRIRAQMPLDEKRALADHVIDNSGSLADTERQVRELYAELVPADASAA
ncbi:MAG TPA: dephospho-CoA kinase [Myxococcota bacterium]|jgi:dephospho-CoA kinase|nr:dephospho-CoA kinase [Myxococcota bacterium]